MSETDPITHISATLSLGVTTESGKRIVVNAEAQQFADMLEKHFLEFAMHAWGETRDALYSQSPRKNGVSRNTSLSVMCDIPTSEAPATSEEADV